MFQLFQIVHIYALYPEQNVKQIFKPRTNNTSVIKCYKHPIHCKQLKQPNLLYS